MIELRQLEELAASQAKDKARLGGMIDALLADLKEEGWSSIAEAKKDMRKLKLEIDKQSAQYKRKLDAFSLEFSDELD